MYSLKSWNFILIQKYNLYDKTKKMTRYNLQNLFSSRIKKRYLLNKQGSIKQTYQIILDINGSSMTFAPGDCMGVVPENDPDLVSRCLILMNAKETETIHHPNTNKLILIKEYLTKNANISKLKPQLFKVLLKKASNSKAKEKISFLLSNKSSINDYIQSHELWDTLEEFYSKEITPKEIISSLLPILPRLYSISSAHCTYPNEAHLTVALLSYETSNIKRYGVASSYLCHRAKENVKVFIHPSHKFLLPKNPSTPIIMIAAGTGIAPFISFLQHRYHHKTKGKNWLFFGECNRAFDFYFEDFLIKLQKENFLEINLAFSRDQKEKIYVQNRLFEEREKIWEWLIKGAHLYLCGDAKKMAKDVEQTLFAIFKETAKMSDIEAKEYLELLIKEKRYLKDVY